MSTRPHARHGERETQAFIMCQLGPFKIFPEKKNVLNDMYCVDLKSWALPGRRIVSYYELKSIAEREDFKLEFYWKT